MMSTSSSNLYQHGYAEQPVTVTDNTGKTWQLPQGTSLQQMAPLPDQFSFSSGSAQFNPNRLVDRGENEGWLDRELWTVTSRAAA